VHKLYSTTNRKLLQEELAFCVGEIKAIFCLVLFDIDIILKENPVSYPHAVNYMLGTMKKTNPDRVFYIQLHIIQYRDTCRYFDTKICICNMWIIFLILLIH